jgi:DmsE family decaheme c-type cytochrome
MKQLVAAALFLTFLLGLSGYLWSAEAPAAKPTYIGTEVCKACHAVQFEKFSKTLMGKIFLFNARNEIERQGCESCHGPASEHVAKGGGRGVGIPVTFRKECAESAKVQNEACLGCHQRGVQTYWEASPHAGRGIACVNCHTIMEKLTDRFQLAKVGDQTPFFNKRAQNELCGSCHLQRKAQIMRTSHMPLREGKITCTNCHNPHGTPNPSQLKQASVNENCFACHAERRGPFLWEHAPVQENCANCHDPHGSVNDRLLKVRVPRLCTQCHDPVFHPGTPRPARGVGSTFVFNRACTNCHSQIHGSNHPSGQRFTR